MKDFFYNKVGCNTAVIECQTNNGQFLLHYHLYDNPVQHIWQKIHVDSNGNIEKIILPEPIDDLKNKLNFHCIQEGLDPLPNEIDKELLNYLHHRFVLSNHNENWLMINDLVHALESMIENDLAEFDSTITFYSAKEKYIPLNEEFKIFLNTDVTWGRMVLGFGTLGKDWIDIAKTDDNIDDLSVQSTISSETRLMFCVESPLIGVQEKRFYNWAKQSNIEVPLNNLNNLALGRYPLGQIIITDALLDYHNNASDWYFPNHICKLKWGVEVLGSITKINKIRFENTDLFYDSIKKHSMIGKILNV